MHGNPTLRRLTSVAVAAAALLVPAGASAETATCVFTGLAGNISPGVMLSGGSGEYDFAGVGRCQFSGTLVPNAEIESHGDYNSIVCGTGLAFSRDFATHLTHPSIVPVDSSDDRTRIAHPHIVNARYHIEFNGMQGTLEIHAVDDTADGTVNDKPESLSPNGHVSIVPTGGSCASPGGVTAFAVSGNLVAQWGPLP